MKYKIGMAFLVFITIGLIFANGLINILINLIPEGIQIITLNPMEGFTTYLEVSFLIGITLMFPVMLYILLKYVTPAMYNNEKKLMYKLLFICSILFLFGIIISFYGFVFFGLEWFNNFNIANNYETLWSLQNTISSILTLCLVSGFVFQFPILLYYLIKKNVIKVKLDKMKRFIMIAVLLLIIGLITPDGSMASQLIISTPVYLLIEISVYLGNKYREVNK